MVRTSGIYRKYRHRLYIFSLATRPTRMASEQPCRSEDANPLPHADDADPFEDIYFVSEFGPGATPKGGGDDPPARSASATGDQKGKDAFPSDEAEGRCGGVGVAAVI